MGDFVQLVQVFYNIMENAFNAITEWESRPEIGHINIHVHYNNSTINDELNKIEISISDNGPGIAQALQGNIFNPFVTSRDSEEQFDNLEKSVGTGLGLSIVRQIIELHRGHISVCSELGHGTTFRICINSVS
ncbi:MAG: ATP-binding protein [Opitutae bacterium]|nr:ATP-binding protein [Opitutae bacterium]